MGAMISARRPGPFCRVVPQLGLLAPSISQLDQGLANRKLRPRQRGAEHAAGVRNPPPDSSNFYASESP